MNPVQPSDGEASFRNKLLGHEFPFDPGAWDDMEKMLLAPSPTGGPAPADVPRAPGWPQAAFIGLALLLVGCGLFFTFFKRSLPTAAPVSVANAPLPSSTSVGQGASAGPAVVTGAEMQAPEAAQLPGNKRRTEGATWSSGAIKQPDNTTYSSKNTARRTAPTPSITSAASGSGEIAAAPALLQNTAPDFAENRASGISETNGAIAEALPAISNPALSRWKMPPPLAALHIRLEVHRSIPEITLPPVPTIPLPVKKQTASQLNTGVFAGAQLVFPADGRGDNHRVFAHAGFLLEKNWQDRWGVQVLVTGKKTGQSNILYSGIDSLENASGLGLPTQQIHEVRIQTLWFAELSVLARYQVAPRWALCAGMRGSWVFPRTTLQTYDVPFGNLNAPATADYVSAKAVQQSAVSSLRRYDAALVLGAEYRLWRNWSLGLRAHHGLFNIVQPGLEENLKVTNQLLPLSSDVNGSTTFRNSDLQLSLLYRF
jgi:hypothetical protein